jgi:hypothetical protein
MKINKMTMKEQSKNIEMDVERIDTEMERAKRATYSYNI